MSQKMRPKNKDKSRGVRAADRIENRIISRLDGERYVDESRTLDADLVAFATALKHAPTHEEFVAWEKRKAEDEQKAFDKSMEKLLGRWG